MSFHSYGSWSSVHWKNFNMNITSHFLLSTLKKDIVLSGVFLSLWCHAMEMLSTTLPICEGNPTVTRTIFSFMMTSSNGKTFSALLSFVWSSVNSPYKGQWRGALMFFFYLCLNKPLSKQSKRWWFEMPSHSLWRHRNGLLRFNP